jgi:hypothetical protein
LIPENFPRKSFENIALAMKRVYQADIVAKLPSRVAAASAKAVAETMARHLQGEGGLIQAFIESAVTMITNEPSVLLNKLENLAKYIWGERKVLEDQPGDFTYRKAISTIMIEISTLVEAIKINQDSAVMNQDWRPDRSSLSYNDLESWVTSIMRGKGDQLVTSNQQRSLEPRQQMSMSNPSQDDQDQDMLDRQMHVFDAKGEKTLFRPIDQVKTQLAKLTKEAAGLTPNSSAAYILYWVLKIHRALSRLNVGLSAEIQREILSQAPDLLLESLPIGLKTPVVLNTVTQNAWHTIQEVYAGINRPARTAAVRGLTVMALTPGVKDLKSLVQVAKDILVLEEMVQHQDVKYWKEPEYNKGREHDVRILVENALAVSDARKAMIQAADEVETMEHIANRLSRVETADTGGSSEKQNSSALQAYPFITEQNQKNGFGPNKGQWQTRKPQTTSPSSTSNNWCRRGDCTNDPAHLYENCPRRVNSRKVAPNNNWCHRRDCANDPAHLYENCPRRVAVLGKRKHPRSNEMAQTMNQMTVVPQVASSNKSSQQKRVHNDKPDNKGWKKVRRQVNLMNSKIMLLEQAQAAGGISGVSPEK